MTPDEQLALQIAIDNIARSFELELLPDEIDDIARIVCCEADTDYDWIR